MCVCVCVYEGHSINEGNFLEQSRIDLFPLYKNIPFEAIQNDGKSECSWLEQRSFIKVLVAEKCNSCEIHRRNYDEYEEAGFSKKKKKKKNV